MGALAIAPVGPTVPHHTYLGGSDIAAVVGLSSHATALDVWAAKSGHTTFDGNEYTRAGSHFERPILEHYVAETGARLIYPGTLVDGWFGATPDALQGDDLMDVQVKMVGFRVAHKWGAPELGADGVPPELLCQIHWETEAARRALGATAKTARVVAQLGTEQRVYDIDIDAEFTATLLEQGERFWRDHVLTGRMPIVTDGANMETLRAVYRGGSKRLDPMPADLAEMVREYDRARAVADEADEEKSVIGARICARIGDLGGFASGGLKATWFAQKGSVDWQACAKALGATDAIAEQYRGEESRVLRVTVKEI